jgi:hypothetical protein
VGTVVEIDDMDVEDIWFTVEDADGETDEYCEADLAIADGAAGLGAAVAAPRAVPSLGGPRAVVEASRAVPSLAEPVPAPAQAAVSDSGPRAKGGTGLEIAASTQKLMAQSKVKGLFDDSDSDDEGGGGGLFD